ncbi:hypothetical protein H696_02783 [Fonticula alba]|uniref:Trafficking protein particle complex subunit n=1 Tax=Fonticula alba TaxID=691883 RepID=A0A058Z845_FONAL|nr:hypothetical protein H696_02783 [Fonticula alba]KCV70440.1 hypothetical protein H696_02783 [Fonticula alba]|eukprot:XP_009494956.1 hypothetical protein H696_02783 [Fonticula alba]
MLYQLLIINKAGGLVYQHIFPQTRAGGTSAASPSPNSNDFLMLAGTFHSIHALVAQFSPVADSSGLRVLESSHFTLFCFQAPTGTKFLLVTIPLSGLQSASSVISHHVTQTGRTVPTSLHSGPPNLHAVATAAWREIYLAYGAFVARDPFHVPEMPIRCSRFDAAVSRIGQRASSGIY